MVYISVFLLIFSSLPLIYGFIRLNDTSNFIYLTSSEINRVKCRKIAGEKLIFARLLLMFVVLFFISLGTINIYIILFLSIISSVISIHNGYDIIKEVYDFDKTVLQRHIEKVGRETALIRLRET